MQREIKKPFELVLASGSVKRNTILHELNLKFKYFSPEVEEITVASTPKKLVTENAVLKLNIAREKFPHHFIIAADTVVVSGKKIFFKPPNITEGYKMLSAYTNNKNYVITGLAVYSPIKAKTLTKTDSSSFKLSPLPTAQLKKIYLKIFSTNQSGGFSIEDWGSVLISNINGSYYNILGLPLHTLTELFNELGTDLQEFIKNH